MIKQESARLKVEPLEARVMMAFDVFLKIQGIDGEATVRGRAGYIEVESFSWGATNLPPPQGGTGNTSMKNFVFSKELDKSTPLLAKACANGEHIKKAILTCRKAGKEQQEYMKWTFQECFISSYSVSGQGGDRPMESLSMNYSKISFTYTAQRPDRSKRAVDTFKIVDPTFETRGPDLDGDGNADLVFFPYANLRDMNRDLLVDMFIPNDGDNNGALDTPMLVDLDGDGKSDDVSPPADTDGDGFPDMVLLVDLDGTGNAEFPMPVDQDGDGYTDDLILVDLDRDGKADLLASYYTGRTTHF